MSESKTAVLVVQGLSRQKPLESLDHFIRGLVATLRKSGSYGPITFGNRFLSDVDRCENFVRLGLANGQTIDVYEYYWGDRMRRSTTIAEIIEWLIAVSDGAKSFYEQRPELVRVCQRPLIRAFRNGLMETNWYLSRIGGLFRAFALVDQVFPISQWVRLSDILKAVLMPALNFFHKHLVATLMAFLGDVVEYTGADGISTGQCRESILADALKKLGGVLSSQEAYDRVLIVGHSLGSVIAYDTVNRLTQNLNARPDFLPADAGGRLKGLVTFGSPLDKVAFLHRFRSPANNYIRRQLVAQRHGFRAKDLDVGQYRREDMVLENPYRIRLDEQVLWINYWDANDLVSGHLDFYSVTENVQCEMSGSRFENHALYWDYMPMYLDIARRFLTPESRG
jgi:hypothetical protein